MIIYAVAQCWEYEGDYIVDMFSTYEKALPLAQQQMKDLKHTFPKWEEVEKGTWESYRNDGKPGECVVQIQEWEVK